MAAVTRWIALAVLAVVGATMLLSWPEVEPESGPEKARSLYGYRACAPPCDLGASYVSYRVNQLFATEVEPGDWARKRMERAPSIGAIAVFGGGRVAFVERVLGPDAIEITELTAETLTRRTVTRADGWPRGFVLVGPRATDEPLPNPDARLI
jgi:hypothetical protein